MKFGILKNDLIYIIDLLAQLAVFTIINTQNLFNDDFEGFLKIHIKIQSYLTIVESEYENFDQIHEDLNEELLKVYCDHREKWIDNLLEFDQKAFSNTFNKFFDSLNIIKVEFEIFSSEFNLHERNFQNLEPV